MACSNRTYGFVLCFGDEIEQSFKVYRRAILAENERCAGVGNAKLVGIDRIVIWA